MRTTNHRRSRRDPQALPWQQLTVLALCRICEPIAFMSIFPYVYYMVADFHITADDKQLALYAGLVTSAYALAEALSGSVWGRLSDKFGRKPILLCGLGGTGISMFVFGFSANLPTAIIARALGGLLNGNIGVLQTTVSEVVTNEKHRPFAFALFPTIWCVGSILGSMLGGMLADPVASYPGVFKAGSLFEKFPYLLANLVCASIVIVCVVIGILFLEETHEDKMDKRDFGLEMGDRLVRCFTKREPATEKSPVASERQQHDYSDEALGLLDDDNDDELPPPVYKSAASSPELHPTAPRSPPPYQPIEEMPPSDNDMIELADVKQSEIKKKSGVWEAMTRQVIYNIVGFGILAYHTISAEQLLPVLFSMPKTDTEPHLPFFFTGGFALSTKRIGTILSIQAIMQMFSTIVVFPLIHRRLGSLSTYRLAILSYPLLYIFVPYLSLVPESSRMPAVYAILVWKVTAQAFAFPSNNMMLANQSPKKILGTFNGFSCSAASGARAVGPTVSGLLQAAGLAHGVLGLPWWCNAVVALTGAVLCLFMREAKPVSTVAPAAESDAEKTSTSRAQRKKEEEEGEDESNEIPSVEDDAAVIVPQSESPLASAEGVFVASRTTSPVLVRGPSAVDGRSFVTLDGREDKT